MQIKKAPKSRNVTAATEDLLCLFFIKQLLYVRVNQSIHGHRTQYKLYRTFFTLLRHNVFLSVFLWSFEPKINLSNILIFVYTFIFQIKLLKKELVR